MLAIAGGGILPAASAAQTALLPDLVADPPLFPGLEQYASGSEARLLLRFDGFVHNRGAGAADVRASGRSGVDMTSVAQRVYRSDGTWSETASQARVRYESEDGHNHWHLLSAARYSLWNASRTAETAPAMKVGFCLEDSERRETHGPAAAVYTDGAVRFCQKNAPTVSEVFMGISAGWRDIYQRTLAFQWVDVSNVSPGSYWLRADVDPGNVLAESDESNAPAWASSASVIPGYVAQPLVAEGLEAGEPAALALSSASFGSVGAREFRVESAPAHGTLSVPVGSWFSGPQVTYTPDAGFDGVDSFSFSARDASSAFPRSPVVATASLGVDRPPDPEAVAIAGAPAEMFTGTSATLTATVTNGAPSVTWTASDGSISAGGVYTAPAVPPAGPVRIRATAGGGAFAEVEVTIKSPPPPEPAPGPPLPPPVDPDPDPDPDPAPGETGETGNGSGEGGDSAPGDSAPGGPAPGLVPDGPGGAPLPPPPLAPLLSVPNVSTHGRFVYARTVAGRAGVVEVKALVGRRRVALCRTRAPAGRSVVCRLAIPRRYRIASVKLVVKLREGRRAIATRHARVPAPHRH